MGSIASQYNASIFGTFFKDLAGLAANVVYSVKHYVEFARAERELRHLDDRMLNDIGLSRSEITYAVRKGNHR